MSYRLIKTKHVKLKYPVENERSHKIDQHINLSMYNVSFFLF